jgi:hypothetical protein
MTIKTTKVRAGLYEHKDAQGRLWIIEHVSKSDGFTYEEWHMGTEDDPHADQYETKRDAVAALERHLEWENQQEATPPMIEAVEPEATDAPPMIETPDVTKNGNGDYTLHLPGHSVWITRSYGTKTSFVWIADGHYYPSKAAAVETLVNNWNQAATWLQEYKTPQISWREAFELAELHRFYPLLSHAVGYWVDAQDDEYKERTSAGNQQES